MNTPFTSFAFASKTGTATRTDPTRWTDTYNVLDFGADPTGAADSTTVIQKCIDTALANGNPGGRTGDFAGIIYFPPGVYTVSSALNWSHAINGSVIFRGSGNSTVIQGNVADFLLKIVGTGGQGSMFFVEDIYFNNTNTGGSGGSVYFQGVINSGIYRCVSQSTLGVMQDDHTENFSCRDCFFTTTPGSSGGVGLGNIPAPGSRGLYLAGSGSLCDSSYFLGVETGITVGGGTSGGGAAGGVVISNIRMEGGISTGIVLGRRPDSTFNSVATCLIAGVTMEGISTAIDAININQTTIQNCTFILSNNSPGGAGNYSIRLRNGSAITIADTNMTAANSLSYGVAALRIETSSLQVYIINCNADSFSLANANFSPVFINSSTINPDGRVPTTFSNAPSSPWEGAKYTFTDSPTASFGGLITSGTTSSPKRVEAVFGHDNNWRVSSVLSS